MNLESFAWIAPVLSVLFFFMMEKAYGKRIANITGRYQVNIGMGVFAIITNLILAAIFLIPLVMLIAPLQLFSISQINMPRVGNFTLSFLLIDFIHYLNHRIHHKVPLLWRLHRLHHADRNVDSLTTWLHHPLEITSTFMIVIPLFVIFDLPVIVMIVYSIVFGVHAAFTHFKILLPEGIDRYLSKIIVTPNAHRVHHSLDMHEGNSNYGQVFLIWDRLFGTYLHRSNKALNDMRMGIDDTQSPEKNTLPQYLMNPFS